MKVSHRLFLAVLPAVLGVVLVAALAYWGEYQRQAPGWLVFVAGGTALGSVVLAWYNTRYVADRVSRLTKHLEDGHQSYSGMSTDELDSIENAMDRLSTDVTVAREDSRRRAAAADQRVQEYAALLAECASTVARQLDEVRLPLHILLENHFGQLNENQEEMLGAARQAADTASVELRHLQEIAGIDQGALSLRRDQVQVAEILRSLLPILKAEGARHGVDVTLDLAPGLPRVGGDRIRLQEAVELLLRYIVRHAETDRPVAIKVEGNRKTGVVVEVQHDAAVMFGSEVALARRVIAAHGGELELSAERPRTVRVRFLAAS